MGKSTISMAIFQFANCYIVYQRVYPIHNPLNHILKSHSTARNHRFFQRLSPSRRRLSPQCWKTPIPDAHLLSPNDGKTRAVFTTRLGWLYGVVLFLYIHIHIYIYTYTHIHIYIYTYIYSRPIGDDHTPWWNPFFVNQKKWTTFGGEDDAPLDAFALRSAKGAGVEAALRPGTCDRGLCGVGFRGSERSSPVICCIAMVWMAHL